MLTLNSLLLNGDIPLSPLTKEWNGSRIVSHVTIIENPDVKTWMRGNELLLVNTVTLDDISEMREFVQELSDLRCCALAIKSVPGAPLPDELVETSRKLHLPLLKIGDDATYLDVMVPINRLLVESERRSFFDSLTARHLLSDVTPSLDDLDLSGVGDFHSERVIVCHSSVVPEEPHSALDPSEVIPLMDQLYSALADALSSLKEQDLLDTSVILAETFDLRAMLFLSPHMDERDVIDGLTSLIEGVLPIPLGISRACPCNLAHEAAIQAEFAFQAGSLITQTASRIKRYDEVEFYRLVENLAAEQGGASLFDRTDCLADHPQLSETLEVFFRTNESLKLTSERLFIHVNTLRYRLDQISKLTGLDWSSTPDKVRLFLGIIHIRQKKVPNRA